MLDFKSKSIHIIFVLVNSVGMTRPGKYSSTKTSAPSMSRSMTNLQACGQNHNQFSEIPFMSNNIGQSKHSVSTTSLISIQSKYKTVYYYHCEKLYNNHVLILYLDYT